MVQPVIQANKWTIVEVRLHSISFSNGRGDVYPKKHQPISNRKLITAVLCTNHLLCLY